MRLDKFLASCGIGSRKEIKQLLKCGTVRVNGKIAKDPSNHINETLDEIKIGDKPVIYREFIYLMLNKPQGYVSATYDKHLPIVCDLIPKEYMHFDAFPVGRLDIDTEGLLILTNDGALTHRVLSPKSHIDKTYFVICENPLSENDIHMFKQGITLDDGYKTMPATLSISENPKECTLIIKEGKFHQVKRMMEAINNKVIYLKRIKMGSLSLDPLLKTGEIRELTQKEICLLETKAEEK